MEKIRLQKFFTDMGIMSRRASEKVIEAGNVKVNGQIAKLGDKVDPEKDTIVYNGKVIKPSSEKKRYIMLNKPLGYVTTTSDEKGRETVLSLVNEAGERLYPVGRLDMYTSGALILTNDGDFVYKITHPKHEINKTYTVTVTANISSNTYTFDITFNIVAEPCVIGVVVNVLFTGILNVFES